MLAFNVLSAVAYAGAAWAGAGPPERDTRSMAVQSGTREATIGTIVLVPAVLDAVRYYHPHAKWAAWASRAAKVGMVALVARARRR